MPTRDRRDIAAGGSAIAVGVGFMGVAYGYGLGTASEMGPGYFPFAAGAILALLGALILVPALFRSGSAPVPEWRPLLVNGASIVVFAVMIKPLGLVPAVLATALVAAAADRTSRPGSAVALAVVLAIGVWLIFPFALGITLPAFGSLF